MKIRWLLLFALLNLVSLIGSANDKRGLLFYSKEVGQDNRTGLDITRKGKINYNESFTISFDISFRFLAERYGYIFQLRETKDKNKLDLVCKIDQFFPDLFMLHNKNETNVKIGLAPIKNEMTNLWYSFQLVVDAKSGRIKMKFDDIEVADTIDFPENSELEWTFGVVDRYGFDSDEVPPMSIRNIRFFDNTTLKYYWPLYQTHSQWTKDSIAGKKAQLIHPAWSIKQHRCWTKIKSIEFQEFPQIAYNKESESIYFLVRGMGIEKYDLNSDNLLHYSNIRGKPYYEDGQQVAFNKENNLVAYSFYADRISEFNEKTVSWNNYEDSIPTLPEYWHHNKMLHPVDSVLTIVCGYGFFKYFNLFQQFDEDTKAWKSLEMSGDEIYPRYLAALGQSQTDKNRYYLFGGLGNKQGKQIFGREFYYDLYQIDCDSNHVTRLWEYNDIPDLDFTPVNSMVVDGKEGCFYTLCFPHNTFATYLQVLKGNLNSPEWEFLADTIPYDFYDIKSFADIYYWETHHELLAITCNEKKNEKGKFEVALYSLNFPPMEMDPVDSSIRGEYKTKKLVYLTMLLPVVLLFALFFYERRKKNKKSQKKRIKIIPQTEDEISASSSEKGRILMFGGFQVFDKNNKDITYRFSPTLKELFLLLILNSVNGSKGVTSKEIKEYLWPDKSDVKAKNNRGVNIKKLRLILEDIGDISISYDGNYWKINHDEEVFCDIEYIKQCLSKGISGSAVDEFDRMLAILSHGNLLANTEAEWLDKIKDDLTGRILNRLEEFCALIEIKENENILLKIADVIFTFDQVNETALEYKCKILIKQGKHTLAREVYNHYIKLYSRLYNEDYTISFRDLVK